MHTNFGEKQTDKPRCSAKICQGRRFLNVVIWQVRDAVESGTLRFVLNGGGRFLNRHKKPII